MKQQKSILHVDMNNFFASVEIHDHPELKGFPVAVCGSVEDRHGIVLAKDNIAKSFGVRTGEAVWEAKAKCAGLKIVPPHGHRYLHFSKLAQEIYKQYTDLVEPFGIDECWLDVTGSQLLFGSGEEIAQQIRQRIKSEIGLTVSIGVSFNKIFAKLGSDIKKPDAVTTIYDYDVESKVWSLKADEMIGVGRATIKKLNRMGIFTLGDLASTNEQVLKLTLGVNGLALKRNALGDNNDPVKTVGYERAIKSIGRSTTAPHDLCTLSDVWQIFYKLSQAVSTELREHKYYAGGIQVSLRDKELKIQQHQCKLELPCRLSSVISETAMKLVQQHYDWNLPLRSIGVRAIDLIDDSVPTQYSFLYDYSKLERREVLETCTDRLTSLFGKGIVTKASLLYGLDEQQFNNDHCSFNFIGGGVV